MTTPTAPTGYSQAQCSLCRRVFSTVGNFDRHLVRHKRGNETVRITCRNPASVGLIQTEAGIWKAPLNRNAPIHLNVSPRKPQNPKDGSGYGSGGDRRF